MRSQAIVPQTTALKTIALTVVAALLVAGAPVLADDSLVETAMPDTFRVNSDGIPVWLSASYAESLSEDDLSLQVKTESRLHKALARSQDNACHRAIAMGRSGGYPDLTTAFTSADYAFVGKVTGAAPGFNAGLPATLLRIEVEEVFRGDPAEREYFAVSGQTDFVFRGVRICREQFSAPKIPAAGDRLIVILKFLTREHHTLTAPIGNDLGRLEPHEFIVLPASGDVRIPRTYQDTDGRWQGSDPTAFLEWLQEFGGTAQ